MSKSGKPKGARRSAKSISAARAAAKLHRSAAVPSPKASVSSDVDSFVNNVQNFGDSSPPRLASLPIVSHKPASRKHLSNAPTLKPV